MSARAGHGRAPVVLAVDVGGTSMKAAVIDGADRVLVERSVPSTGPAGSLAILRGLCADLAREVDVAAVGVVTPGLVDEDRGVVAFASNLDFRDVPLRQLLQDDIGVPVAVGHDGRAAGLAEGARGAARGRRDYLVMPIGTGISAAIVKEGRPIPGAIFAAGEVGHMPVYPDGEQCPCGQAGCLEVYASAAGVLRRYRAALRADGAAAGAGAAGVMDAAGVVARLGVDAAADRVWADATRAIGHALVTLTLTLDPGLVVLGGGLAGAGERLLAPVRAELAARLRWRPAPPVVASALGPHAAR